MQKTILFSLLFCLSFLPVRLSAQTKIAGKVIDSRTMEGVPFSLVQLLKNKSTSISNVDGDFQVNISSENLSDSLIISNLGYQPIRVSVAKALKNVDRMFYLKPITIDLAEVTVKPIVITDLLKVAIKTSSDKTKQAVLLSGYYREVVKTDTSITKYADGLLDYYIERGRKNRVDVSTVVKQSRVKELKLEDEDKFDGLESKIPVTRLAEFIDPATAIVFDSTNFENYSFKIKETEGEKGIYIITFKPNSNSKLPCYEGTISIDKTSNLILGLNYKFSPTVNFKVIKSVALFGFTVSFTSRRTIVNYQMEKESYYPIYMFVSGKIVTESKKLNQTNEFKSEFITSSFANDGQAKPRNLFSKKYLYQNGNKFSSEFWKSLSINPNTIKESNFLKNE